MRGHEGVPLREVAAVVLAVAALLDFVECLKTLSKPGEVSPPVEDKFVEYARSRVVSVDSAQLEKNLA